MSTQRLERRTAEYLAMLRQIRTGSTSAADPDAAMPRQVRAGNVVAADPDAALRR